MPTNREVSVWDNEIGAVTRVIGSRFLRRDLRAHAESYLAWIDQLCGTTGSRRKNSVSTPVR
jgi:hypothetical protein